MKVTITHVEAGASTSFNVLTDQDIPIRITIEDIWSYGEEPGHAIVGVVGPNPEPTKHQPSALLGEVVVNRATQGTQGEHVTA